MDVLTWAAEQQRLATEPAGAMPAADAPLRGLDLTAVADDIAAA